MERRDTGLGGGDHRTRQAEHGQALHVSLDQLEPFLLALHVDEIDKQVVNDIVRRRRAQGTTNATIKRDLVALSSVLKICEEEGWCEGNPAFAKMKTIKERRDPIVLPEPAHVERVIAKAPGHFADMIRVAWLTGCRQDELRRMERRHLNFERGQISIYKTKTGKPRVIEMRSAEPVLAKIPPRVGCDNVFWHSGGEYLNISSNFRRLVAAAHRDAKKAKQDFRPFRFHDLRHLFAVEWLRAGGSIHKLSKHLGHTSVSTTEIYEAHITAAEAEAAREGSAQSPAQVLRMTR